MRKVAIPLLVCITVILLCFVCFGNIEVYLQDLLEKSTDNKGRYAVLSLLVLSSDIILPIPSSVVMFLNGLILGFVQGASLTLAASLLSSCAGYVIGRYAAKKLKRVPDNESISILNRYGNFGIIITRGIPILSESICFTAGYLGMNFRYYMILNFIGYLPICFIYAYFGNLGQGQSLFLVSFGVSILVSLLLWIFGRKLIEQYVKVV
jgi:uncharacterized membrane protein YdjX (TVP38/TMEM64 family)